MKRTCALLSILLLISSAACKKGEDRTEDVMRVAVSIYPVYSILESVAGERVEAFYVVPEGANPHTFEPDPGTVQKLYSADIYIGITKNFDGWVERYLPVTAQIHYLADEKDNNPHIWLSLKRAADIAAKITDALVAVDQKNRIYYSENLERFQAEINTTGQKIAALFSNVKSRKFIQWHPAWNYFAAEYGLEIIGTIQSGHGDSPTVKEFRDLVVSAKASGAGFIVIGLRTRSSAANALAKEIGGRVLRLDTMGGPGIIERSTYLSMMYNNAEKLSRELNR